MTMVCLLCLAAPLLWSHVAAFQPLPRPKSLTCLYYKSKEPNEHELTHNPSLAIPNDNVLSTPELWSQEWHDSFVRNGLVDFVPPLSSHLNCLLVGDNDMPHLESLPSTPTPSIDTDPHNNNTLDPRHVPVHSNTNHDSKDDASSLTQLFDGILSQCHYDNEKHFDCILDRGLMDQLVSSDCNDRNVGLLLLEATRHIREHGVYIVVTRQEVSAEMKEYLVSVGAMLGMQWRFDLDGISDQDVQVSVARRYLTGELPSVGKLATVKRP